MEIPAADRPRVVTLRTPGDAFDLAAGSLIERRRGTGGRAHHQSPPPRCRGGRRHHLHQRRRRPGPTGRTSRHLTGAELLHHVLLRPVRQGPAPAPCAPPPPGAWPLTARCTEPSDAGRSTPTPAGGAARIRAPAAGCTPPALFTTEGALWCLRQDTGRHNAVDKGRRPRPALRHAAATRKGPHGERPFPSNW